jgi:hypothetical protein
MGSIRFTFIGLLPALYLCVDDSGNDLSLQKLSNENWVVFQNIIAQITVLM